LVTGKNWKIQIDFLNDNFQFRLKMQGNCMNGPEQMKCNPQYCIYNKGAEFSVRVYRIKLALVTTNDSPRHLVLL
jgi:hypothetical protein